MKDDEQVIGPGSVQQSTYEKPSLDGMGENYYAEILNPLTVTFRGKVASSRPKAVPFDVRISEMTPTVTRTEDDIRRNYGLDLKNADHTSVQHFTQTIDIPPGATIRLPGNEAQVIIRQLVNIMMDKRGQQILKGDSWARKQVENEIIIKTGTMDEFFTAQNINVKEVLNRDLNHDAEEEPFPDAVQTSRSTGIGNNAAGGDESANPKPGSGSHYQKQTA
jgi:hypothetical protein